MQLDIICMIRKASLIVLTLAILAIVLFHGNLFYSTRFAPLRAAVKRADNYYTKDFDITMFPRPKGGNVYGLYEYELLDNLSMLQKGKRIPKEKLVEIKDSIRNSFSKKCRGVQLKKCNPLKTLMPYCMAYKGALREGLLSKREYDAAVLNGNFSDSLAYWRSYFEDKPLREDDLNIFVGYLTVERLCGNLDKKKSDEYISKLLKLKLSGKRDVKEAIHFIKEKVSAFRTILGKPFLILGKGENKNRDITLKVYFNVCKATDLNSYVGKIHDICTLYEYFTVKNFCVFTPLFASDEEISQAAKYLRGTYPTIEGTLCHIGLLRRAEAFLDKENFRLIDPFQP